ncbi:glycoside hydrolase family 95 protein [Xylogone sp. PMI_703]|nr:glycoside hydrolase family 95 protein [Xylogone sp. PMI_703]
MLYLNLVILASCTLGVRGKQLWSNEPAAEDNIIMTAYPVGNGKLAHLAMPLGTVGTDIIVLNEHSLWSGGPFQNSSYIGGNPHGPVYSALPGIREVIWQTQINNDISALYGPPDEYFYGNYETLGNLTVSIEGITKYSTYRRSLNLENGIHQTVFKSGRDTYTSTTFCSYPDQVCVYHLASTGVLPTTTVGLQDNLRANPSSLSSCDDNGVRLRGQTQADIGMIFEARVQVLPNTKHSCTSSGAMIIPSNRNTKVITLIYAAGTDYDQKHGNAANNYSFKGVDPEPAVLATIKKANKRSYAAIYNAHVKDHGDLFGQFTLNLPDPKNSAAVSTPQLMTQYTTDGGNPFIESLLFDYGRYLFIASSRPGSLPPNLQGIWAEALAPAWSADYHVDINLQMNHWHTEQTGLGEISQPLWDFMTDTWVPRGSETANLLYDAPGWVGFSNLNTFGFTGQMNAAVWSDYPASAAWMMKHVWDRYDYGRDETWYRTEGYPLLKGIAEYWIHELVEDQYFNDGTLVAAPCNSPEHLWTTFGCTHYQQVVWEVFDHIIAGWKASGDTNTTFLETVKATQEKMDKGIHIGDWGQLQVEWKIGWDQPDDEHRHLSHLAGWYPGYSVATHYRNSTITNAVNTSLTARGNGTADSNTGWEKVWRVACWAQLNNTDIAYTYLKYTIDTNFADNGFSVYTTCCWPYELAGPFQIDANFGYTGAILAMLVTDLPIPAASDDTYSIILGPAIPAAWAGGSVKGLRLRGGGSINFSWNNDGLVTKATLNDRSAAINVFNKDGKLLAHR